MWTPCTTSLPDRPRRVWAMEILSKREFIAVYHNNPTGGYWCDVDAKAVHVTHWREKE